MAICYLLQEHRTPLQWPTKRLTFWDSLRREPLACGGTTELSNDCVLSEGKMGQTINKREIPRVVKWSVGSLFVLHFPNSCESSCLLQELLKCILQLEEFKGMTSCGCIWCVRRKVSLCGSGMEPEMIAAKPVASTCQHECVSKVLNNIDLRRQSENASLSQC